MLLLPSEDHLYGYQVIAFVLLRDKSTRKSFPKNLKTEVLDFQAELQPAIIMNFQHSGFIFLV